jgi:hypothetical protein
VTFRSRRPLACPLLWLCGLCSLVPIRPQGQSGRGQRTEGTEGTEDTGDAEEQEGTEGKQRAQDGDPPGAHSLRPQAIVPLTNVRLSVHAGFLFAHSRTLAESRAGTSRPRVCASSARWRMGASLASGLSARFSRVPSSCGVPFTVSRVRVRSDAATATGSDCACACVLGCALFASSAS